MSFRYVFTSLSTVWLFKTNLSKLSGWKIFGCVSKFLYSKNNEDVSDAAFSSVFSGSALLDMPNTKDALLIWVSTL